eukprot:GFKZ01013342.1.p1 GENE.GFKZ01013342.1~~GFKZ01013342.1.p1  ORF type:complete len:119 (-),score=13.72 GFKZ01013342.1:110-466(-)
MVWIAFSYSSQVWWKMRNGGLLGRPMAGRLLGGGLCRVVRYVDVLRLIDMVLLQGFVTWTRLRMLAGMGEVLGDFLSAESERGGFSLCLVWCRGLRSLVVAKICMLVATQSGWRGHEF